MSQYIRKIQEVDDTVVHMISIGGWNAPHPVTSVSVEDMYAAFKKWNNEQVDGLLQGIDWDLEGHDDMSNP